MDQYVTMQEFMLHTKSVVYIIMLVILAGFVGFWHFLTERDDEDEYQPPEDHE
jgi:hypothetical protein